jgi:hypothetical protein
MFLLYAQRHQNILGAAGHIVPTPAKIIVGYAAKNMVTDQCGIRTCDHSLLGQREKCE